MSATATATGDRETRGGTATPIQESDGPVRRGETRTQGVLFQHARALKPVPWERRELMAWWRKQSAQTLTWSLEDDHTAFVATVKAACTVLDPGSSPRVRGTAMPETRARRGRRFIPRVCGERTMVQVLSDWHSGSSPRVRGTGRRKSARGTSGRFHSPRVRGTVKL